ncbi:MAG: DUF432 domain-containing protein [Candidatus Altiarchaeota archaeon]|nr:DUF432 domain-containing protein [Candidatus Altiarchaeota archaeon]
MFGKLSIEKSHKNTHFSVEKKRGYFVYKRDKKTVKLVSKSLELEVRPLIPINLPDRITDTFMVRYSSLHIGPGESTIVFLKIPIEIGVFFQGESIDTFGFSKEEFVLYGPVDGGLVARNVRGEVIENPNEKGDGKSAIIPLRIKNYLKDAVKASRLLLNTKFLEVYYKDNLVATEMVKLDLHGIPRVRYMNRNYFKGMTKIKAKKQVLKKEEVSKMEWGV